MTVDWLTDSGCAGWRVEHQKKGDHWWEFTAHEISGVDTKGKPVFGCNWTNEPDEDTYVITGYIKWDGCSEIQMPESYHLCGRFMVRQLSDFLLYLYDLANEVIGVDDE